MPLKTPAFWYKDAPAPLWLRPLSWLYGAGRWTHKSLAPTPYKSCTKVLCVGNLTAGGSGKTPAALALMSLIKEQNFAHNPIFLTRGYGADEDKILQRHAPTIVSADRRKGAQNAEAQSADLIIMDDGFQNPALYKDISLLVIDGAMGFGNGALLPAGPLREPISEGLKRADGIILIGDDERGVTSHVSKTNPVFTADICASKTLPDDQNYVAFAGLGYPEKFFTTLRGMIGDRLLETHSFPDHHPYSARDLADLRTRASALGAALITTEKDAARLPEGCTDIQTLPIELVWRAKGDVTRFLKERLFS
ncbi:MAG: tetraacyldisaccharide 4'-kinase [Alphaproteobacteria bacterium]|nr:tetraacyldisaccharide 4'-kinase [Alphaproteobacteria bacterium]